MSPVVRRTSVAAAQRSPSAARNADGDVAEFVEALDAAQAHLRSIADEALSELGGGVTATQLRLLARLERLGQSRLIDLADALAIAPSTATRLCDALADRQLIVRHRRGRDRRELQIRLTERGSSLLEAVRERTVVDWAEVLEQIAPRDRKQIAAVLLQLGASGGGRGRASGPSSVDVSA